ncbi:Beta-ketoacyl synthase, partial [Pyrenophora tritici-repentis]
MASPRGELLVRIGENIIPIFKKEVNPLELMFGETNLMPRTYDQGFPGSIKPLLAKYLEALSFNRPNLRIMEVGAGTGSATEVILEVLGSRTTADLASIGRYHFTDLSGGFLERARKRFSKWSSLMEYDILDIERDPAAQGFQAESYDVVVATHVLHATADLQRTLANVRSLLKPGGKLLLIENMQPDLRCTPFAFGVLPGWWTSIEPDRALNPLIREDRWNEILGKSGFTSTNLILRDTEDNSAHEISVVVSTAMKSEFDAKTCGFESILAVCGSDTQLNSELVVSLDSLFANMTYAQFNAAIKPKVQGSLNLIEALPRSIDFFICLSSAAAVVGNRGQANYVAANTFQDALAEHLVLTGLPGLSINLGSVLTVGWVAENQQNLPISAAFGTLSEEELLSVIEYHIDPRMKAAASVDTCHTVAGLRSSAYFVQRGLPPPAFMQFPFFSHLLPSAGVHNTDGEKEIDFPINDLLKTADSLQTAGDAVSKAIGWKLSRVMSIPTEDIDLDRSLTSYGVDSLVTVDFRTWIMKDMAAIVQASDILSEK